MGPYASFERENYLGVSAMMHAGTWGGGSVMAEKLFNFCLI